MTENDKKLVDFVQKQAMWHCVGRKLFEMIINCKWLQEDKPDFIKFAQRDLEAGDKLYRKS